ncbi:uncharacterized protein LOC108101065 [Drosophila ficusphila]|uniref:uncharacterized protein LOC108101065 n=1 Tax=Drosophila ficusphila TaxID=30025 RepID=UPI0007E8401D|nr:uncharacterized protein LOC108101065 [Drosophila ficusphila]
MMIGRTSDMFGQPSGKVKSTEPSIAPIDSYNDLLDQENDKPKTPSWVAWCERNSKPVKRRRFRMKKKQTRWQKSGPMTKKDWKHFFAWASNRAMPRELELKPERLPCLESHMPCNLRKRKLDEDELLEKMQLLAKPRKITQKYDVRNMPPAYSPVIFWGKPPHHDPGRPFKPPYVPGCFVHNELEADFWAQLRFPVRQAALKAHISPRIRNLSKPRTYPPIPHCPIPEKVLDPLDVRPPPRKKFTPKAWRSHQIRLMYLSKPVFRNNLESFFYM